MNATATSTETGSNSSRNREVATTIRNQIRRALVMIGGRDLIAVESGLKFRVKCRGTKANHITITLDPNDTYTFVAQKITGGRLNKKTWKHSPIKTKTVLECSGAYCDMLADLLAQATGLCVRL